MRTAIVHYWLLNMRGGEKVVEALCRLLPEADIFTLFYDPESVSPLIRSRVVTTSYLQPLKRVYRSLLPLMPSALESLDLRGYDLVVSSESGPAKGVLTPSVARHVCYCHTPMRYLWDLYPAYRQEWTNSILDRAMLTLLAPSLRVWDYTTAARVDQFVANSKHVQRRIWKTYRRCSQVITPPVAIDTFYWRPPENYYLIVSALVSYKRLDTAVRAFSRSGRRLRIVGEGPEYRALKKISGPTVEFIGFVPELDLRDLYSRARALVIPGEEDFGITSVEALASGKPVIALARGGALETVPQEEVCGGFLFPDPSDQALTEAIVRFERFESSLRRDALRAHTEQFSENVFAHKMRRVLFSKEESDDSTTKVNAWPGAERGRAGVLSAG